MTADTKQRILDVSEQMFADHGFAGTSLRGIIGEADVNLAAVHYHFHSKEALMEAVLVRRLEPLNRDRLALLDGSEKNSGKAGPSPEVILDAFIGPPMRLILNRSGSGRRFGKLVGRLHSESGEFFTEIVKKHFSPVSRRFMVALHRAFPELPEEELYWRMHCAIGVMAHSLASWDHLESASGGLLKTGDVDAAIRRLVNFLAAGFRAPVVPVTKKRRPSEKRS